MNNDTMQLLKQMISEKREVRYIKSGSRNGWVGRITKFNPAANKITIVFSHNGLEQDYSHTALIFPGGSKEGFYDGYIEIIEKPTDTKAYSAPIIKEADFLILSHNGALIGTEDTYDEALAFATEQVVDQKVFTKVHVFQKTATVQTKMPEVEVLNMKEIIG